MFGSDSSDGGGDLDRDMYQHHHRHQRTGQRSSDSRATGPTGREARDYHHARDQTRLFRSGGGGGGGSGAGSDMSGLGADLAGEK